MSITILENKEQLKGGGVSISNLSENDKGKILKYLSGDNYIQRGVIKTDSINDPKDFFEKLNSLSNEEKNNLLNELKEYFENKKKVETEKEGLKSLEAEKNEQNKVQEEKIVDLKNKLNESEEKELNLEKLKEGGTVMNKIIDEITSLGINGIGTTDEEKNKQINKFITEVENKNIDQETKDKTIAKLPVDDMLKHLKANDPKINPNGFKNLLISEIDYQNSIKLLEAKSNALKNVDMQTGWRESMKEANYTAKKIENSSDITIPKGKFEAPVEKKLSPEVEKLYIETIDDIKKWSDGLFNEIQGKLITDSQKEILVKEYTKKIKDDIDYKELYVKLSSVDQKSLETNIENFCERLIDRVNKFNKYQTGYNKIKKRFNDNNEIYRNDILSLKQIEKDLENGKINKDTYDEYKKILLSGFPEEFKNLKENNPLSDLLITTDERFLFNRHGELELIDIDLVFKGSTTIVKFNKINQFEDVYGIYSAGGYSEENGIINIRPDGYDQTGKPIFNEETLNHELQHSIYDAFFSQSDIKEIASKYRKLKDKTKRELSESIKSIKEENINSFVNETLKSGNESVMELSVDEILAYKKDGTEAVNIFENLTETNDYNYTLELNDFLKSEFLARNIDISETINKFTHKKIEIIAELVNLSQHASIEELSMTPYKERHKFDKTGNTKKSDLEF